MPGQERQKETALADVTLDQAIPVVRNLAERKANAFVRRCRLAIDEREDVESQLILLFITRWPKFNGERASVQTFASRLMDAELMSILRYRFAQRRQPQELPVSDSSPTSASIHQFRIDLERVLDSLPGVLSRTASVLSLYSAVDAAAVLRCSRQTIGKRKRQIQKALLASGIRANYFGGRGARP